LVNFIRRTIIRLCWVILGRIDFTPIPTAAVSVKAGLTPEERSTYAKQLAANPLLGELFDNLQAEAFKLWIDTSVKGVESREYLWTHHQVVILIERRIRGYLANAVLDENIENRRQKTRNTE
jgi:hypothetical protein